MDIKTFRKLFVEKVLEQIGSEGFLYKSSRELFIKAEGNHQFLIFVYMYRRSTFIEIQTKIYYGDKSMNEKLKALGIKPYNEELCGGNIDYISESYFDKKFPEKYNNLIFMLNEDPNYIIKKWLEYYESIMNPFFKDCLDPKKLYWIEDIKIESQRNWIPKNPVWIVRTISNCYENSKPVIESIEEKLQDELNKKMRLEKYGKAVNCILLKCAFSYYDNAHCKTNYVIDESGRKLSSQEAAKELQKLYTKEEISENGYYLRPRFQYGSFKADTGTIEVVIHLEKEFSLLTHHQQKEKLAE